MSKEGKYITTSLAFKARKSQFRYSKNNKLWAYHCKHDKLYLLVYTSKMKEPLPGIKQCVSEVADGNFALVSFPYENILHVSLLIDEHIYTIKYESILNY